MKLSFSKDLYPKVALIKSAYHFTDKAYVHLDVDEKNYIVSLECKEDAQIDLKEFQNEMLAQTARYEVYRQTKDIRRLTVARALASTLVDPLPEEKEVLDEEDDLDFDIDKILTSWFEDNE